MPSDDYYGAAAIKKVVNVLRRNLVLSEEDTQDLDAAEELADRIDKQRGKPEGD